MALKQEIRFAIAPDGVSLAWTQTGSGPPLVKAANWLSHLEFDLESPVWRHYVEDPSGLFTLVRYDERGAGLSDWDPESLTFDDMVADLETIIDASGVDRFALLGISQGASIAIEYAVRYPERVTHLIILGGYVRGRLRRNDPEAAKEHELHLGLVDVGWGTDDPAFRHVFTEGFIPGGTSRQHEWFDELMRRTASKESAKRLFNLFASIDVTETARRVTTPTLILHSRGDRRVRFSEGRELASLIPGARLVQLDSDNHLPLEGESAWRVVMREMTEFVLGAPASDPGETGAVAMLMTDIVDSTKMVAAIGDEAWSHVIRWHDETLAELVVSGSGTVVSNTGDGLLATFADADDAIRCAAEIQRTLEAHRRNAGYAPQVRMGINVGVITHTADDGVAGLEIHKTARVAAAAEGGEILLSAEAGSALGRDHALGEERVVPAKGIDEGELPVRPLVWR